MARFRNRTGKGRERGTFSIFDHLSKDGKAKPAELPHSADWIAVWQEPSMSCIIAGIESNACKPEMVYETQTLVDKMKIGKIKGVIQQIPIFASIAHHVRNKWFKPMNAFPGSKSYWIHRYRAGGTSGQGSRGKFAAFKAEIINEFVLRNRIQTVIEYGCGDGSQLMLSKYPSYTGFDVSPEAISTCRKLFSNDETKTFKMMDDYRDETAELTLSLDVIYHLTEEDVFIDHMHRLFDSSARYVIIHSYDDEENQEGTEAHVKHRKFSKWVGAMKPEWRLIRHVPNRYSFSDGADTGLFPDFFIYEKKPAPAGRMVG